MSDRNHRQLAERNLTTAQNQLLHLEARKQRGEPSEEGVDAIAVARSGMAVAHSNLALLDQLEKTGG